MEKSKKEKQIKKKDSDELINEALDTHFEIINEKQRAEEESVRSAEDLAHEIVSKSDNIVAVEDKISKGKIPSTKNLDALESEKVKKTYLEIQKMLSDKETKGKDDERVLQEIKNRTSEIQGNFDHDPKYIENLLTEHLDKFLHLSYYKRSKFVGSLLSGKREMIYWIRMWYLTSREFGISTKDWERIDKSWEATGKYLRKLVLEKKLSQTQVESMIIEAEEKINKKIK